MTSLLKRPKNHIFKAFSSSHLTKDAQFAGYSSVHEKSSSRLQRRFSSRQAEVLNNSSLPFSCLLNDHSTCSINCFGNQIPGFLPHPIRVSHSQEKLQLIGLPKSGFFSISARFCFDLCRGRGYCNVSGNVDSGDESRNAEYVKSRADPEGYCNVSGNVGSGDELVVERCSKNAENVKLQADPEGYCNVSGIVGSGDELVLERCSKKAENVKSQADLEGYCNVSGNVDSGDESSVLESCSKKAENMKSQADPEEVERVYKVIHELFALDRNMEAGLDECGVRISHDLVVDVLDRFKHAWKPAYLFFCWSSRIDPSVYAHDSRTYNAMMSILGRNQQFETMVSILEEMGQKGKLDIDTFVIAMKSFAAAKEREKAVGIFELMEKYNFKVGVETFNCLLDELGRAKLGKEGQQLFKKLEQRFPPNLQTFTVLLNGWCRVKNLNQARKVWDEMIKRGFKHDIVAHNIMLEGLLKARKTYNAFEFFEIMKAKGPKPNVVSYTILIRYLCKQEKMREASGYFDEMVSSGNKPDAVVYTCMITGFGNVKKMDAVYALLKEMKIRGCPPDGRTYTVLIKLMTNRRMTDDAIKLYKKMIQSGFQPTAHTYNMLMKSFFMNRDCESGCEVWEEMMKKGCCPDENSYVVYISGLIRYGRSVEALKYLEEMMEKGMKAPQIDYEKFVADFSRVGKDNVLEELAEKMKFSGKLEMLNFFKSRAEILMKKGKKS